MMTLFDPSRPLVQPARVFVAALACGAVLSGCGGESSNTAAQAQPVESSGGAAVDRFPSDFPVGTVRFPLGFVLDDVQEEKIGGKTIWVVDGTVPDPRNAVHASLVSAYGDPPDTESGDTSYPNDIPAVFVWADRDGFMVTFTLTEGDTGATDLNAVVKEIAR